MKQSIFQIYQIFTTKTFSVVGNGRIMFTSEFPNVKFIILLKYWDHETRSVGISRKTKLSDVFEI